MLLVEHTRCAEHGELVHDAEAHHHGGPSQRESGLPVFRGASEDGSDETHEHCALTADRRDALPLIVGAQASAPLAEPEQSFALTHPFLPFESRRFRVAPKNSPPA